MALKLGARQVCCHNFRIRYKDQFVVIAAKEGMLDQCPLWAILAVEIEVWKVVVRFNSAHSL